MTDEERKKAVAAFANMSKNDKMNVVVAECSKLLIAAMEDSKIENYVNGQMIDDKGVSYQLIFVRKPIDFIETK